MNHRKRLTPLVALLLVFAIALIAIPTPAYAGDGGGTCHVVKNKQFVSYDHHGNPVYYTASKTVCEGDDGSRITTTYRSRWNKVLDRLWYMYMVVYTGHGYGGKG